MHRFGPWPPPLGRKDKLHRRLHRFRPPSSRREPNKEEDSSVDGEPIMAQTEATRERGGDGIRQPHQCRVERVGGNPCSLTAPPVNRGGHHDATCLLDDKIANVL